MNFDIQAIIEVTGALFLAIDIVGSIPIITKLREKAGHIQSEKTVIVAGILFFLFLFFWRKNTISRRSYSAIIYGGRSFYPILFCHRNDFGDRIIQR